MIVCVSDCSTWLRRIGTPHWGYDVGLVVRDEIGSPTREPVRPHDRPRTGLLHVRRGRQHPGSEPGQAQIARDRDTQGFPEHKKAARTGGEVADKARRDLETKSGRKVVTNENYLSWTQGEKKRSTIAPAKAARKKRK